MFTNLKELTEEIEKRTNAYDITLNYLKFKKGSGKESFHCGIIGHNDKSASFIVKEGLQTFICASKCGNGNIYQLLQKTKGISYKDAVLELSNYVGISEKEIEFTDLISKIENSLKPLNQEHYNYFKSRGISKLYINMFGLKSKGDYIAFPHFINNNLVARKFLNYKEKNKQYIKGTVTDSKLFPDSNFEGIKTIIFVEGEYDCILFTQKLYENNIQNIKVVTSTTGSQGFPKNLINILRKYTDIEQFYIFYDKDISGETGALKLANELNTLEKDIYIYSFNDDCKKGYDITDFFLDGYELNDLFNINRKKFMPEMNQRSEGNQYENERTILNFILLNNEFLDDICEKVMITDFKDYRFINIFNKMKECFDKYKYFDMNLLKKKIFDEDIKKALDEIMFANPVGSLEEIEEIIEGVRTNSTINDITRLANKLLLMTKQNISRQEMISESFKSFDNLLIKNTVDEKGKSIKQILTEYSSNIHRKDLVRYISTHSENINTITNGGFRLKKLTIIGALPSVGKTSWALEFFENAGKNGNKGIYYALETDEDELGENFFARRTGVNSYRFKRRYLPTGYNSEKLNEYIDDFDQNLIFVEAFDMYLEDVINDIRIKKRKYGIDFTVIDLLQAFKTPPHIKSRTEYINNILAVLVDVAKQENIALIVLSHLKTPEKSVIPKRPKLEDFAQSNNIGQRGYTCIVFHENGEIENTPDMEIIYLYLKNRNGLKNQESKAIFKRSIGKFIDKN